MPAVAESHLRPSRGEVDALAASGDYGLIPLAHTFVDDLSTPVAAFLKLRAADPDSPAFLLESAEQAQQVGRYSMLGIRPREVVRWSLGQDDRDPYDLVADLTEGARQAHVDGLPPFIGGAVGLFGYDLVRTVEPLGEPNPDEVGLPDLAMMLTDTLVVFDHLDRRTTILANVELAGGDVDAAYDAAAAEIRRVRTVLAGPLPEQAPSPREPGPLEWQSNHTREAYEETIRTIVEYIYAGDAFQIVASQRWSAELPVEPFSVYRGLRAVNPSPYMYYLDFGDFQIAGASPEPLLRVVGDRVETYPVAGTRRRTGNPADDAELASELLSDEKERAEHIMLVDLARNDLGRVSKYGSVVVDELMKIDTFSHLLHISSLVSGTLRDDVRSIDALRSTLPAGTLSGAPKVRAMQIIDELEPVKRSWYAGAVGYLTYAGDMDTCINIRSVAIKDGIVYAQTGGGTVADATPENEYEESVTKSLGTKRAIDVAIGQEDWGMTRVLVIDNYDSFTYNLVQLLGEQGVELDVVRNDRATVPDLIATKPDLVVISPGPCTPDDAGISLESVRAFPEAGIPMLGVCLGHQSLAQAFGGKVIRHMPVHGKTATIEHNGEGLYATLPERTVVGRYHSLIVEEESLPDCFEVTARGGGVIQGIRHRTLPAEGVQFHPESVLTPDGRTMLANFLALASRV